ncbi:MAG: LEA type 2 family protein [Thiohalocapsa sp.]|jgi:LEA14-like dessication related protein|uniref:LEA type 2 family protein n=1 Tax=Thiohalocapsa sp. TaxID=2497641 RepID=UPI0025E1D834|nr:LEA type 2 family protein [Thiohalocapsa sp.]MCG6942353.1 LEA type 2 family protein [Thiohalocapsa sp.]
MATGLRPISPHWPIALAILCALLSACATVTYNWKAPEVQVTSIQPEQIGLGAQTLRVGLNIKNPNDRTLPIKAMTYTLSLDGTQVAEGGGKLNKQIPAFGEAPVKVLVLADAGAALRMLPALALKSGPINYHISGIATVAGVVPIPYRYSGKVKVDDLLRAAGRALPWG